MGHNGLRRGETAVGFARRQRDNFNRHYAEANAGYNPVAVGATKAQEMVARGEQMQQSQSTVNNNQKYVDVKIGDIKVQSSENTIGGTVNDGLMAATNFANQLVTGMS